MIFALCAVFAGCVAPAAAALDSNNDLPSINNNRPWYDPNDTACSSDGATAILSGANSPLSIWKSGLQPPYSLEEFVVEVLKDIASKLNVSQSDTVTEEHVIALVAFAWGEGGNLTNDDIYNPWNTGYSGPDLQPVGGHSTSGVQSYASFDQGVEAAARVMTGAGGSAGYQTRLGSTLANPSSTAEDFMKALTYYQNYKGNMEWATASMPPYQDTYYQQRLTLVAQTRQHYADYASTELGPPGNTYTAGLHVPVSSLKYIPPTSSRTVTGGTGVTAGSSCNPQASAPGSYQNPLRALKHIVPERIDGGVDYNADDGPIYAIGNGKVTFASTSNTGWPGLGTDSDGAFIAYKLSDGPAQGDYVYIAEDCTPVVKVGDTVSANTPVCNYHYQGTAMEMGWSNGSGTYVSWDDYSSGGGGNYASNAGQNYSKLMVALGAPAGIIEGTKSTAPTPAGWPTW